MEKIVEKPFLGLRIVDIQSSSLQNEYKRLRYVYLKEKKNICRYITFCVLSEEIKIFKVHFKTYLIQMKEAGAQNGELEKNLQNYLNHSRPENSKKSRQKNL